MGHKEWVHIQNREGFIKEGCESIKNHSGVLEGVQIDRAFIKEGCSYIEVLLYNVKTFDFLKRQEVRENQTASIEKQNDRNAEVQIINVFYRFNKKEQMSDEQ